MPNRKKRERFDQITVLIELILFITGFVLWAKGLEEHLVELLGINVTLVIFGLSAKNVSDNFLENLKKFIIGWTAFIAAVIIMVISFFAVKAYKNK